MVSEFCFSKEDDEEEQHGRSEKIYLYVFHTLLDISFCMQLLFHMFSIQGWFCIIGIHKDIRIFTFSFNFICLLMMSRLYTVLPYCVIICHVLHCCLLLLLFKTWNSLTIAPMNLKFCV